MLYLDYAATTPPFEEVADTMIEIMKKHYGNPSSLHRMGLEAEQLVSQSRAVVAKSMRCLPEEIRFTSGGTESNNWAIQSAVRRSRHRGKHLITTEIEHASVYETFAELERDGFRVTYLPVDRTGSVNLEALKQALTDETVLVSIMAVNNEMGRIQPVSAIGGTIKKISPAALFHVDAVQAVGKIDLQLAESQIDLLSCSAHKLRGPKGIGFLYVKQGLTLPPLLWGGGQEGGLRSGTENVPAIVGMAKAVRMVMEQRELFHSHTGAVRERIISCLRDIPELVLNGSDRPEEMAPHIVNLSFPGMKSEVFVHALEERGIYVSSRSACSSSAEKPSRVLKAMGCSDSIAVSGIRISYSLDQTMEDAEFTGNMIKKTVEQLKSTTTKAPQHRRR